MRAHNTFLATIFTTVSLLFCGEIKAVDANLETDDLGILLSPEERALVEREARKQDRKNKKPQMPSPDLNKKSSNPYAELLEENGVKVKTNRQDRQETTSRKKKRRSAYSSPENYKRYKTGSRRPGDALKSTPAQRAFGS